MSIPFHQVEEVVQGKRVKTAKEALAAKAATALRRESVAVWSISEVAAEATLTMALADPEDSAVAAREWGKVDRFAPALMALVVEVAPFREIQTFRSAPVAARER